MKKISPQQENQNLKNEIKALREDMKHLAKTSQLSGITGLAMKCHEDSIKRVKI